MKRIKIIEKRPILHLDICENIVKIFKKRKIQITAEEARHLWDLHGAEHGLGWMASRDHTDKEIFDAFEPYYIIDNS